VEKGHDKRELLSSSNKEEDEDVKRKKTENLAWAQRDAIIKGLLSSSSEEEEDKGGEVAKWNKDITVEDLLEVN
jgi:hypothetical protein